MKLAFTTLVCPQWSLSQIADAAVRLGYHGVEFRCDAAQAHGLEVWADEDALRAASDLLQSLNLTPCCLATGVQLRDERHAQALPARAQLAAALGCPGLRVLIGALEPWQSLRDVAQEITLRLREAAELAGEYGVEVWLETHDTAARVADAASLIHQAGHPNLGLLYDNLHPQRLGEDLPTSFAHLQGRLRHVHLHDGLKREDIVVVRPLGEGDLPMNETFRHLRNAGYTGFLTGEWFHDQYGPTPEDALERYAADINDLAIRHGVTLG